MYFGRGCLVLLCLPGILALVTAFYVKPQQHQCLERVRLSGSRCAPSPYSFVESFWAAG
jgi:hypothetical protein